MCASVSYCYAAISIPLTFIITKNNTINIIRIDIQIMKLTLTIINWDVSLDHEFFNDRNFSPLPKEIVRSTSVVAFSGQPRKNIAELAFPVPSTV